MVLPRKLSNFKLKSLHYSLDNVDSVIIFLRNIKRGHTLDKKLIILIIQKPFRCARPPCSLILSIPCFIFVAVWHPPWSTTVNLMYNLDLPHSPVYIGDKVITSLYSRFRRSSWKKAFLLLYFWNNFLLILK